MGWLEDKLKKAVGGSSSGGSSGQKPSGNILSSVIKPEMAANLTSKIPLGGKAADVIKQIASGGNIASAVVNPKLVNNILPNVPGADKLAPMINQAVGGITNDQLASGAKQLYDTMGSPLNMDYSSIFDQIGDKSLKDVAAIQKSNKDIGLIDPLLRGLGGLGSSIGGAVSDAYGGAKDFLFGGKEGNQQQVQGGDQQAQEDGGLSVKDKLIRETKRIGGQIGGGLDTLKEAAAQNKALLNMGIQGSAAYAGYQAGKGAREQVGGLLGQQLQEMQGVGGKFQGIDYDPQRYAEQQQFLRDRIAGGGYTAEEKQMQQQGDVRGAKASAAARLAGVEQMARLSGATGSGAALASALTGGQAMGNIQAETEAARQASGVGKKEAAIGQQAQILRQKTAEEADLAKQQADLALQRQQQVGATREKIGSNVIDTATQEAGFYGKLADLGTNVLTGLETAAEKAKRENTQAIQEANMQAETERMNIQTALDKKRLLGMDTSKEEEQLQQATKKRDIIQKNTQTITQAPKQVPVDGTKTPNYVMQQPQATTQTAAPAVKPPVQAAPPAVKANVANPVNTQVKQVGNQLNKPLPATKQTAAQKFNNQNQQAKFR